MAAIVVPIVCHAGPAAECRGDDGSEIPANLVQIKSFKDYLRDDFLPLPQQGDFATSLGAIVDSSCLQENPAAGKAIEKILASTFRQAEACAQYLGAPLLSEIVPILRRATIVCDISLPGAEATASSADRDDPTKPAGWSHHRTMRLNLNSMATTESLEPGHAATTMFHEALHWTAANNYPRDIHAHLSASIDKLVSKPDPGLCINPQWTDRIYFFQAACFPGVRTLQGSSFYDPHCPSWSTKSKREVCRKVLSSKMDRVETWRSFSIKPDSAERICNRIGQIDDEFRLVFDGIEATRKQLEILKFVHDRLPPNDVAFIARSLSAAEDPLYVKPTRTHLKNALKGYEVLFEFVDTKCSKGDSSSPEERQWTAFCQIGEGPIRAFLRARRASIRSVSPEFLSLLSP
jgi:hypothetical protein